MICPLLLEWRRDFAEQPVEFAAPAMAWEGDAAAVVQHFESVRSLAGRSRFLTEFVADLGVIELGFCSVFELRKRCIAGFVAERLEFPF